MRMNLAAVVRRVLSLAIAAAVAPALFGQTPDQQSVWKGVERIVAVGDVHGDYGQFVKVLLAAGVVNKDNDWVAGKTHLVQVGDVLDRGPDSRKVMDLLMRLERQAAEAGGKVHALIGNHEAMVVLGDLTYADPGEEKAFGGRDDYLKAMSPEGKYGRWILSHNAAVKINNLLFVHAGITSACVHMSLDEINAAVRDELKKRKTDGPGIGLSGPLWDRTLALGDEAEAAKVLGAALKAYGASRMVIGHTVTSVGIMSRFGGRLIQIDVGMSEYYGGPAAGLVVEKGDFFEVRPGLRRKLPPGPRAPAPATSQASYFDDRFSPTVPSGSSARSRAEGQWRQPSLAGTSARLTEHSPADPDLARSRPAL